MMRIVPRITNSTATIQQASTIPDGELITQVLGGNNDAFAIIMRRYNQRLYRIARSILREENEAVDVVQESYVKAYYQLKNVNNPEGFASWLSRIVSNEALQRVRKAKHIDYSLDEAEHCDITIESPDLQPMDALANKQLGRLLEDAIDQLPVHYRSVYVMRAIQQLNTEETATSLGLSGDVVKTRYRRAKKALQVILDAYLKESTLDVFEFAGNRCDSIVKHVLLRLN